MSLSKVAKGKKIEKKAREFLEALGYETYSPPHVRYSKRDVLGYGDIVYVMGAGKGNAYNKIPGEKYFLRQLFGSFGLVQVKTDRAPWGKMVKLAKKFPRQVRLILMMWSSKRKEFRFFFYKGNSQEFKEYELKIRR